MNLLLYQKFRSTQDEETGDNRRAKKEEREKEKKRKKIDRLCVLMCECECNNLILRIDSMTRER